MRAGADTVLRNRSFLYLISTLACALPPLQAGATLLLTPDGAIVYDTVNNVSWLANSNLAATNRFGLPICGSSGTQPCIDPSGSMSYQAASAWVKGMNSANYLGHSNWQLPTTPSTDNGCGKTGPQQNNFGFGCSASAFGSLYYNELGLKAPNTAVPIPIATAGPFSNFEPSLYWSQTSAGQAGYSTFSFNSGFQGANTAPNFLYMLPMIPGKIPGTPPTTGTGLQVNPGGQTVYDPATNVTWLANANLGASNTFGLPACTNPPTPALCVNQDGAMTWDSANQFVTNMNAGKGYLGQTNWQLPPIDPNCNVSYLCDVGASNPFGELYYGQLGLSPGTPVVATPDIAVGPFNNIQPYLYWACGAAVITDPCGTPPAPGFEWSFSFGNGFEGTDVLANDLYVTAYFVGPPVAFFNGSVNLGSGVYYLQFPNNNLFGYFTFVASSIVYHYDMGYEAFIPGSASDIYLYDFASGHWLYTSSTLFPYLYDFTLNTWLYYFPDTKNPGHYTTNPRYFSNLTNGQIFMM
jgi:hypothetical protein